MQLKTLENSTAVFMNDHDYDVVLKSRDSRQAGLAMQIMGRSGPRVGIVADMVHGQIEQSTHPDVDLWFYRVQTKDTLARDTDGKWNKYWIPADVKEAIDRYAEDKNLSPSDPYFRVSKRTVQNWVKRSAKNAAKRTGNEHYEKISAHDFRRYFATNLTVRQNVDPEIVMTLGGWEDRATFWNNYVNTKFDDAIQASLADAGALDMELDRPDSDVAQLADEVASLQAEIAELRGVLAEAGVRFEPDTPDDSEQAQLTAAFADG